MTRSKDMAVSEALLIYNKPLVVKHALYSASTEKKMKIVKHLIYLATNTIIRSPLVILLSIMYFAMNESLP